jgi:trans-2,3-dihydro-3-hydroxyanthranilate isomerase
MKLSIVDVFAESQYEGNQLAVVEAAAGLDDDLMQRIAREMNFSETTFVTHRAQRSARVRIFTPDRELPFAGHPTLGTAFVLANGTGSIKLELAAGDVEVWFDRGVAWMLPPPATLGLPLDAEEAAALIGLTLGDLDGDLPPLAIECGPRFSFVAVESLAALGRVQVDLARTAGKYAWPFIVCRRGHSPQSDFAARKFFFDGSQTREDPATGSANTAFAALLKSRGETGQFVVDQGVEMRRPSRIYLDVGDTIKVGGKVHRVAEGELV